MVRWVFTAILVGFCLAAMSCSNTGLEKSDSSSDPFVGFFAGPGVGMIDLQRAEQEHEYSGSMWSDFGPFPIELVRDGDVARGTVSLNGNIRPLQLERTTQGFLLTVDGTRAEATLQHYRNRQAYEKSLATQAGSVPTAVEETTRP